MARANADDLIFSFANKKISYVGVVLEKSIKAAQPRTFGSKAKDWADTGWLLKVEWEQLKPSFSPEKNIDHIKDLLPKIYSPYLTTLNKGRQGAYLAQISKDLADVITAKSKNKLDDFFKPVFGDFQDESDRLVLKNILSNKALSDTEKRRVAKARIGQGEFRQNVFQVITHCPVTGIGDEDLLVASHIKAWRDCNSYQERLDGENGLPLAPHIDKLFDKGFITFDNEGILIASQNLSGEIERAWGLTNKIGEKLIDVSDRRAKYLEHHRKNYFQLYNEILYPIKIYADKNFLYFNELSFVIGLC